MKVLIIDSHKGGIGIIPTNLHWENAKKISDHLGADLIWSYDDCNETVSGGYDAIVFNHASHYTYTDYEWIRLSPNAELYYIVNEYNLGEPRTLWMAVKRENRHYTVIANHSPNISKIVQKYVKKWHIINLNAISYAPNKDIKFTDLFQQEREGCVYYGNFRKDRAIYFEKYVREPIVLSTSEKNRLKFMEIGCNIPTGDRIDWAGEGLSRFKYSLYIEDKITHVNYNHLANRFYEALNYDCVPLFGQECSNTVRASGYDIGDEYFLNCVEDIKGKSGLSVKDSWHKRAKFERIDTLERIKYIIAGGEG